MAYRDKRGYQREDTHSNLVHRHRAYHHIYLKDRKKYPLPFEAYEVHHIDGDKNNNRMDNLAVLTPEEHDKAHDLIEREKYLLWQYGLLIKEFETKRGKIMKEYGISKEEFANRFERIRRIKIEDSAEFRRVKPIYSKKQIEDFKDDFELDENETERVWELFEQELEDEARKKEDEARKKARNEKIKSVLKKGFRKLFRRN